MGLLFIDGFDHYATSDMTSKWSSKAGSNLSIVSGAAKTGSYGLQAVADSSGANVGSLVLNLPSSGTQFFCGFALKIVTLPTTANTTQTTLVAFAENSGAANLSLKVVLESTGKLRFVQGGSGSGTLLTDNWTGTTLTTGTWYYVEVKVKWASSTAAADCEIRVDYGSGPTVVNQIAASQNTTYGGQSGYSYFAISEYSATNHWVANSTCFYMDDLYVLDTNGSVNTGYLGNCKVETLTPAGAGASAQWTRSTGTNNYANVNEIPDDGDTTYNYTTGTNNRDSFTFSSLSSVPQAIYGVQAAAMERIDASETTRNTLLSLRISGSYYDSGNSGNLTSAYIGYRKIWETNPATSSSWNSTVVNALEAGIKLVS
jgi:hypothetical protein